MGIGVIERIEEHHKNILLRERERKMAHKRDDSVFDRAVAQPWQCVGDKSKRERKIMKEHGLKEDKLEDDGSKWQLYELEAKEEHSSLLTMFFCMLMRFSLADYSCLWTRDARKHFLDRYWWPATFWSQRLSEFSYWECNTTKSLYSTTARSDSSCFYGCHHKFIYLRWNFCPLRCCQSTCESIWRAHHNWRHRKVAMIRHCKPRTASVFRLWKAGHPAPLFPWINLQWI